MTRTPSTPPASLPRRAVLVAAVLLAAGGALAPGGALEARPADPPPAAPGGVPPPRPAPPPLPAGLVARVNGRDVTVADYEILLARRLRPEASADPQSPAATILEVLIRETLLAQEASRLGIVVGSREVDAEYKRQDDQVRLKSNGASTLADLIQQADEDRAVFLANLRDFVLEERIARHPSHLGDKIPRDDNAKIAQINVVVGQLMQRAAVERTGLPPGVVARVNGVPIREEEYGKALALRLVRDRQRDLLWEHCATMLFQGLTTSQGVALTDADIERAIAVDRARFARIRALDVRPEMQSVTYEAWVQARNGNRPLEELKKDPFFRGRLAIGTYFRGRITDDEVRVAWTKSHESMYGPSAVVTHVQATFKAKNALTEPVKRRTRDDAMRLVKDYERRIRSGEVEKVLKEIRALKDPSLTAEVRRVRASGNLLQLYDAVATLRDGEWAPPFETISEWNLVRRDRFTPAPSFEEAKDDVREDLVTLKMQSWLDDQRRDPNVVQMQLR
jgi:hypothetical protein